MAIRSNGAILRQIRTLYDVGAIGDLTDAQLLERFTTLDSEAAELAFAALVERHGPMVLRVCRNLLKNPQDAEDACQATFFVLVRKARFVWVRDSLAPWLHRVARRVAMRARASALRRREHEPRAAELKLKVIHQDDDDTEGLLGLLYTEIDRLPEKYRTVAIVCDIEGLSHERAARQLGWPVGTVKSRVARARQLLRSRLTARGLAAPIILALTDATARSVDAAVSLPVVKSALRPLLLAANAPTIAVVSVSVANLAEEVLETMFLTKMKLAWAGVLTACALAAGTAAVLGRQYDGADSTSAAGGPGAKRADIVRPADERAASSAPDFIKQSRDMIITRLEEELALAKARLDRTLKRVVSPDAPAALQAKRTVDEIEGLLARIDGVLVDAVNRFPTMFDFSGKQADLSSAPGAPTPGTMLRLNVNDVYQSSIRNSGNWQKNNPSELAPSQNTNPFGGANKDWHPTQHARPFHPSQNTNPFGGANKDGAQGQGNPPSFNGKAGDWQGNNAMPQAGQNANPFGNRQEQSNQSQPQDANKKPQQNSDQSQRQSSNREHQQNSNQSQQQGGNKPQERNATQPQQQGANKPQQEDTNQRQPNKPTAGDGGYDSNNRKASGVAAVDLTVYERQPIVDIGGQTTFVIRLRNRGTKDATDLLVTANLSRNLEFVRADGDFQGAGVASRPHETALTFKRIDKCEPDKEIILEIVARVSGSNPKLATCRVSVSHDDLPDGTTLEDMAGVSVTSSRLR